MRSPLKHLAIVFSVSLVFVYGLPMESNGLKSTNQIHVNLTDKERDFLKKHPVITAHNEADYPPL